MIIDFHTHAFPDALAERAMVGLVKSVHDAAMGFPEVMYSDGTAAGLVRSMERSGVDMSVLLPVATKPSQPHGINEWAKELSEREPGIIPFGAFFPDDTFEEQLETLAAKGYKGIKLHGDFQNFYADDSRMTEIYRRCGEYGLICVHHAGLDCVSPRDIHVTPERMARVLDRVTGVKFVLAHMGGNCMEDRAAELLAGAEGLWVDTAYAAGRFSPEKMTELISRFGSDKVLFASDSPWNDPAEDIKLIRETYLSDEEKERIFHKNAERLLGIT